MKAFKFFMVAAVCTGLTGMVSCESTGESTESASVASVPAEPSGLSRMMRGVPALTSGLRVPPRECFHLGERPTGDFVASVENIGEVPVDILLRRGGTDSFVARLAPGEKTEKGFLSGDGVLFENESATVTASLKVRVWGEDNLAMYYTPLEEGEPGR